MRVNTDAWWERRPVPKGKVVVEVQEAFIQWRRLMALRAHYADMIDKLEHMDKGEMEGTQGATDHLEDLHLSML